MTKPRLALTSTPERAVSLGAVAERAGLAPVSLPCIEYVPADSSTVEMARARAAGCDWLVLTSARAVATLWPRGGIPAASVAAVGPATAAAVRTAGGDPTLVGDAGSEELFDRLSVGIAGRSVFVPHAAAADLSRLDILESAGAVVDTMAIYDVRPMAPGGDPVEAVAFGSPTAVEGWLSGRTLDGLVVGAIGETTKAALTDHEIAADFVPEEPSFDHLISLIAAGLRDRSTV